MTDIHLDPLAPRLTAAPAPAPTKWCNPAAISNLSKEDQSLFQVFGRGELVAPRFERIHLAFESWAAARPEATAAEHGDTQITYSELNRQANRLASHLQALGVEAGDNVALFLERSIPMVVGMFASLKLGAAYVPQHVGVAPEAQLSHILRATKAPVILTLAKFADALPTDHHCTVVHIDELMVEPIDDVQAANLGVDFAPDETCFVLFTSGTTGPPNGVQVTHRNICNILATSPGDLGMGPGMKVAQILSIAFDMAAWETLGALMNGATLLIRGKSIQETVARADVVIATPSILGSVDAAACHNVSVAAVAGEPCPKPLADTWGEFCRFHNSCGPTETTIINTAQHYRPEVGELTIGAPTPNNTVYVLDASRQPLPIGEVGEMWAGGDCVTAGYLDNPDLTAERYAPDPFMSGDHLMFRTRDLGRWTEDGELEHYGRTDDQVKVRGFRVELDSVSAVLESVAGCTAAVTLKFDDRNLVAFVQPETVDVDAAKAAVGEALPYYAVPMTVTALESLPRTDRGKVDKRLLLDHAQAVVALDEDRHDEVDPPVEPAESSEVTSIDLTAATEVDHIGLEHPIDAFAHTEVELPEQTAKFRRIWKDRRLMHYNRLVALMSLVNLATLGWGIGPGDWFAGDGLALGPIANMAVANLSAAILIRQQYVINLLFRVATAIPTTWPLKIRWTAGKVYHFGGIHVGGAVGGTLWFAVLLGGITWHGFNGLDGVSIPLLGISALIILGLTAMIVSATPALRNRYHDTFEQIHRFVGWSVLGLFWVHALLFVAANRGDESFVSSLLGSLTFWLLGAVVISVALPWTRLKYVPVDIERPSSHVALVRFNHGVTPFAGSSTTISRSPLREWHSFANVPAPDQDGFRLTISRAGDWTANLIDNPPGHLWVKGITTAGVGNVDQLFKKVVWVATGSGIGPTLPHLLAQEVPAHLIWATRNPWKTYGDGLVDEILNVQPNATFWDTDAHGKPDMVKLAYQAVQEFDAEAVIVISNKKLTWQVVEGMERIGIPAYGAIWDS